MNDKPRFRVVGDGETSPEVSSDQPAAPLTFDELSLKETQYGDELIGELTDDEADVFVRIYTERQEMKEIEREIGGSALMAFGQDLRQGRLENQGYEPDIQIDPVLAKRYFYLTAHVAMLQSDLFFDLGERYNSHDYSMMVRSKRRVVRLKRKY